MAQLSDKEKTRFRDQVLFHVELHESGCLGFVRLCKAFFSLLKKGIILLLLYGLQSQWRHIAWVWIH